MTVTVDIRADKALGRIPPGIYGQYLEHVEAKEETIYPALWDDASPHADNDGIRTDVTSAVRELNCPVVRWPGGCFADVYHWEDAIGPRDKRQPKPNKHWGGTESNMFGTDEFLRWCQQAKTAAYVNVNLGTGTLDEALRWLEYCNGAATTTQGERRAANGHAAPYNVKYWGIGNETWGPWEAGHTDAATYGTSLSLWAKAMRMADPAIRILGVGSHEGDDPAWDREVIARAGADIDMLTVHMYGVTTKYDGSEYENFVLTPLYFEDRLRGLIADIDATTASSARRNPLNLAIDEWNIRHFYDGKQNRNSPRTLQDALFSAGFLNAMIRLSPRVEMANYVFLANGNATLLVNDAGVVRTPLAYVFQQYAGWMHGTALATRVSGGGVTPPGNPMIAGPGHKPHRPYTPPLSSWVDVAAARHDDGKLAVSLVNRHQSNGADISVNMPAGMVREKSWVLTAEDIHAKNTFKAPHNVKPVEAAMKEADTADAKIVRCPPRSITLVVFKPTP